MKVTINELVTFISIVDEGTISQAAEHLDVTVSAVSRALSRLEKKLNTALFRRTTRRLELTQEGEKYLVRVRSILEELEAAENMLIMNKEVPSGKLRIDAATPFMLHVIAPLIDKYSSAYPQIDIELISNENLVDLLEQRTDIAVRIGELKDSTLSATPLGLSQIRILASPAYLKKHGTPQNLEELTQHQLLGFSSLEKLNDWPIYDAFNNLFHVDTNIKTDSGETLRQLALCGTGIVCLSDFMTQQDIREGRLVQILISSTIKMQQPINLVYYKNRKLSERVSSFIEFLKAEMPSHK
ncbi:LysR substrate-binding domain-containing protein [Psychrobacter alimentarius]|uniref:LysR family transcriptional regulator n=1 Tax=Psychrobacter alimentarius TaxID=261164 RepID=A0ABN4N5W8_9GAMM|nr:MULTISPECIES: LysR family transcriptional regulator [Psychrobacter]AMT96394.1 LysR family transcriptional regulator [Psychrobacter alimentarius]PAT64185.1 LysR family transcriptional regulator [Psychrobacter sp. JB193]QCB31213.1 LysR family transcriptional regulator [Psychrobacter sp. PAMC27889]